MMDDVSSETCLDWLNNMNFKNIVWFIKAISYFVLLRSLGNNNNNITFLENQMGVYEKRLAGLWLRKELYARVIGFLILMQSMFERAVSK